jgi:hypothetical protein
VGSTRFLGPYPDQYVQNRISSPSFTNVKKITFNFAYVYFRAARSIIRNAKLLLEKKSQELRKTAEELLKAETDS